MDLYEILKKLNIAYEETEHPPVYTVEEAKKVSGGMEGEGCKVLFLKHKKKYFLLILQEDKRADLKYICEKAGVGQLSFASAERLYEILGLEEGSVTPFGIINDEEKRVVIMIDSSLKGKKLLFHPCINTKTLSLAYRDLIRFIEFEGSRYLEI